MAQITDQKRHLVSNELRILARRRKTVQLQEEGLSKKDISKRLGVCYHTTLKDIKWIEEQGDKKALQRALKDYEEKTGTPVDEETLAMIPHDTEAHRDMIREAIVEAASFKKTYREVSQELGVPISVVHRYVTSYAAEVMEYAGRTVDEHRQQQIMLCSDQIVELNQLQRDLLEGRYDMTHSRAIQQYNSSAKVKLETINLLAKLLGTYQQKQESKVLVDVVHSMAGVDWSGWTEGEWVETDAVG